MEIYIFEGSIEEDQLIDCIESDIVPKVGETITVIWVDHSMEQKYQIDEVNYKIDVKKVGTNIISNIASIRCAVRCIS